MRHEAVRKAYPMAIVVNGDDATDIQAWDAAGNEIVIDWVLVSAQEVGIETTQLMARLSNQIQKRLDDFAATRRYSNVDSLEKYKGLTDAQIATLPAELQTIVLRFRAECDYLVLKTAETWAVSELIETRVLAGNWPTNGAGQQPTDISDFEAELPVLAWPV